MATSLPVLPRFALVATASWRPTWLGLNVHTNSHRVLADLGLIEAPFHFSFIMGVLGGIPASARHLAFQAEQVPAGSRWKAIGISRDQWTLAMAALALGGDVRIGLEDNFYLPDGTMAQSNGELVAAAA